MCRVASVCGTSVCGTRDWVIGKHAWYGMVWYGTCMVWPLPSSRVRDRESRVVLGRLADYRYLLYLRLDLLARSYLVRDIYILLHSYNLRTLIKISWKVDQVFCFSTTSFLLKILSMTSFPFSCRRISFAECTNTCSNVRLDRRSTGMEDIVRMPFVNFSVMIRGNIHLWQSDCSSCSGRRSRGDLSGDIVCIVVMAADVITDVVMANIISVGITELGWCRVSSNDA